jgi:hypothetical protein
MPITSNDTVIENIPVNSSPNDYATDFSVLLNKYGLAYVRSEYYWMVGAPTKVQGWILHLSVIKIQILDLLNLIIPELIEGSVPFKIVIDLDTAGSLLDGNLGYIHLGKLVSIYPENDLQALQLAQKMITLTSSFKGPAIPTDFHLGSILYTRYGSFQQS